jgi:hypothetical protein
MGRTIEFFKERERETKDRGETNDRAEMGTYGENERYVGY